MMRIDIKDLSVNYAAAGKGLPFLALHGWGVDHRLMSGCLEPVFKKAGLRCRRYYPDLPGMGATPGSDAIAGSDDMLDYVEEFIDALFPGEPFLLAGESYGGYLARGLVRRMGGRIRGLLLICPSYKPWVTTEKGIDKGDVPEHQVIEADEKFLAELSVEDRRSFQFMAVRQTRDAWKRFKKDVLPGILAADQDFLANKLSRNVPFRQDPDELASPFDKPTLIVTARQDASVGYRGILSILESYPRASFAVLDGGGHNLQTERVGAFEGLVADWLERVDCGIV
jgi:pimeloyl-ACP methyl ester carboxylesterase